jgi:uncharacterized protein YaeQ
MALKATVHKATLQVSDLDRHYYASHALTLAQHPSETDRGVSSDDEPDLWRHSLSGEIEQWIELGQPDEARLRRASGRAREVVVIGYAARAFELWWEKNAAGLVRLDNLKVLDLPAGSAEALGALLARNMDFQIVIESGELQLIGEQGTLAIAPRWRQPAP